jgi:hypothetical protein
MARLRLPGPAAFQAPARGARAAGRGAAGGRLLCGPSLGGGARHGARSYSDYSCCAYERPLWWIHGMRVEDVERRSWHQAVGHSTTDMARTRHGFWEGHERGAVWQMQIDSGSSDLLLESQYSGEGRPAVEDTWLGKLWQWMISSGMQIRLKGRVANAPCKGNQCDCGRQLLNKLRGSTRKLAAC